MALEMLDSAVLADDMANTAEEFSQQLRKLAVVIDTELSQAIRKGVLDVFKAIVKRSPVDTGAYRASHGIANMEPAGDEDIVKGKKGEKISASVALSRGSKWTWKVGDGNIFLFNNLPYAERLENGWSQKQAPNGVYRVALVEVTYFLNKELAKLQTMEPTGGE